MKLRKYDVVTFNTADGKPMRGTAIRYDARTGEIVVRVMGKPFRWEGGPPGEYLDRKGNFVPGAVGYSDSLWVIPFTAITGILPPKENSSRVA